MAIVFPMLAPDTLKSVQVFVPVLIHRVKAGTIIPANNATAKGILVNDVYVGEGEQPGALIVEGYILKDRLPKAPTAEAITALKEIKFY